MTDSPLVKRLIWSGLLAGTGAISASSRPVAAAMIYKHFFDEEPPE